MPAYGLPLRCCTTNSSPSACGRLLRLRCGQLHVQYVNEERPAIGLLLDDLGGGLAGAMARLGLDADQHGIRAALRRLQRRGILEGVGRHDAIVVIGGGDERRSRRSRRAGPLLQVCRGAAGGAGRPGSRADPHRDQGGPWRRQAHRQDHRGADRSLGVPRSRTARATARTAALGDDRMPKVNCSLCNSEVEGRTLASPQKLENRILDLIKQDRPEWEAKRGICSNCLEQYRAKKFVTYLEAEYQKLSELELSVVSKITRRGRVSKLVHQDMETQMLFGGILVAWMIVNAWVLARHPFDPYPFILLNLVLSTLAALQAPVIMMSQNRQAHKDRMQANQDYEINLMAEIEIRDLHDKLDSLRFKQWHELWHIQKRQIELLEHLCERDANPESKVPPPSPYVPPEL